MYKRGSLLAYCLLSAITEHFCCVLTLIPTEGSVCSLNTWNSTSFMKTWSSHFTQKAVQHREDCPCIFEICLVDCSTKEYGETLCPETRYITVIPIIVMNVL